MSEREGELDERKRSQYKYMGTYVPCVPLPVVAVPETIIRLPPPATHFHIPPLQCSFPSRLHPHYELVKKHCDPWILDTAQPPSAAACYLLLDCLLPRLICRVLPAASSVSRLVHLTKMVSWLTIADDDDDHPDSLGADDTSSAEHASHVMAILRSKEDDYNPNHAPGLRVWCSPIYDKSDPAGLMIDSRVQHYASCSKSERKKGALEALARLWGEIHVEMTPVLRDRFVSAMEAYLQAVKIQATFRKSRHLPDIDTYMEIRRQACFFQPSFALAEYALHIEEAYNNPLVQKFRNLAFDYMFLCNDLISCKAEIAVGDYFNMPSIVYSSSTNKEWSFQDAIDYVANMIKDLDLQCLSMLHLIQQSSSPSLQHSSVNTYITTLCSCMSGTLAWHLETARYRDSAPTTLLTH